MTAPVETALRRRGAASQAGGSCAVRGGGVIIRIPTARPGKTALQPSGDEGQVRRAVGTICRRLVRHDQPRQYVRKDLAKSSRASVSGRVHADKLACEAGGCRHIGSVSG